MSTHRFAVIVLCIASLGAASVHAQPVSSPATLETDAGTVHGTLLLPESEGPHPVALIIPGSGPTDRDGNSAVIQGKNNSLKLLAEGLAAQGIASLRFDKRGVGESTDALPSEEAIRFGIYVADVEAWAAQLQDDERFGAVVLVGHSEGSLLALAAAEAAEPSGLVSIAGVARPAAEVLREQLGAQLPPALMAEADTVLMALERGETTTDVPPTLASLFRPSVQPYLISWFRYDPAALAADLDAPLLVVQGTTDIQVQVADAEALAAADAEADLVTIEGMNHVLKDVPAEQTAQLQSYGDPTLPLHPTLVPAVAAFIQALAP